MSDRYEWDRKQRHHEMYGLANQLYSSIRVAQVSTGLLAFVFSMMTILWTETWLQVLLGVLVSSAFISLSLFCQTLATRVQDSRIYHTRKVG